ncbi:MAG: hypothetical protein GTO02_21030 [Candidatus Dadabacteria bacterium]|nr:hypothetical protein [Candidatus Dadabacteria bacterium]
MQKINRNPNLYIQLGIFALVWGVILIATDILSASNLTPIAKKFPIAVTIYMIIVLVFTKSLWKLSIFQGWLVKIPNIHGTWRGELRSTWKNPETGVLVDPIPAVLVIKQDYFQIHCSLFTPESTSHSLAADLFKNESGLMYLSYNYTNRSSAVVRVRSEMHDGATILQFIHEPKSLKGEYWTSRQSTGEMEFVFESAELAEKYSEKG